MLFQQKNHDDPASALACRRPGIQWRTTIATGQGAAIHWIEPDPWSIAGNVFSNFYEEFIFRGFLLTALAAVIGFLPAAIVTSALWAATHTQYPLSLQITIFAVGLMLAWVAKSARTFGRRGAPT